MGPADARFILLAFAADRDAASLALHAQAFGAGSHRDALPLEDLAHRLRHVLVLAGDEPRRHLDDRHARAEAPVHLAELEADIASPPHACDPSGRARAMTRAAISTIVTREPKRRYIWPNSRPI